MTTTTTALHGRNVYDTSAEKSPTAARVRVGRSGIGTVGVLTVLISAWGVLIPFVGPVFGFRGDGAPSWHWSTAHLVLAVLPGAIGFLMGLVILQGTSRAGAGRGRVSLALAGLIAMLCGAWFIVGPVAWPVVTTHGAYLTSAAPLRSLAYQVGYGLGTGVILAVCGGYVMGWASRHQMNAVAPVPATTASSPAAPPAPGNGTAPAPAASPSEAPVPMA